MENLAKLSNKGVFIASQWNFCSVIFHSKSFPLGVDIALITCQEMWRRRWGARGLSQHGSLLWGDLFQVFFHSSSTHISTYVDFSKVQVESTLVSSTASARVYSMASCTVSVLKHNISFSRKPYRLILAWSIKQARDFKLYNAMRIKILDDKSYYTWVSLSLQINEIN